MKRARLSCDLALLAGLLGFPPGIRIERIKTEWCLNEPRHCEMVLSGNELPVEEIGEGQIIPMIEAIYTQDGDLLTGLSGITVTFRLVSEQ